MKSLVEKIMAMASKVERPSNLKPKKSKKPNQQSLQNTAGVKSTKGTHNSPDHGGATEQGLLKGKNRDA